MRSRRFRRGRGMTNEWHTEITVFEKHSGPLSKRIWLDASGKVCADGSECLMTRGYARRVEISDIRAYANQVNRCGPNEAFALGRLRADLPSHVRVVTAHELNGGTERDTIARTKEFLTFAPGMGGLVLVDYDPKQMSAAATHQFHACGGLWGALCSVLPGLDTVAMVERSSTSSGLRNTKTGESFPHSGGKHLVIPVLDAADIPRFLSDLHDRCWLNDLGWGMVSAAGSFLARSIVDKCCGSPERLIFEGAPVIVAPLVQDARQAIVHDGFTLDTRSCAPLTVGERGELQKLIAAEELRLLPERQRVRAEWSLSHIQSMTAAGMAEGEARALVDRWIDRKELSGAFPLPFDDAKLAGTTVAEVLAAPDQYVNKTLSDPFEGPAYGRGKAIIFQRADGSLFVNSFAHGGMTYDLKDTAPPTVSLNDFYAYMPQHTYIFVPTREIWVAASVNARIAPLDDGVDDRDKPKTIKATTWLDRQKPVEQMTWAPGEPTEIKNKLIAEGGWIARPGCTVFNLYQPPTITPRRGDVRPWLDHIAMVFPDDNGHIIDWLAHRVQRPQEKVNHALVLGGAQGIGKDTLLEPVKAAIGPWNFVEVSPRHMLGRFNGFLKCVILRVNEERVLGDVYRYAFYDHMNAYTAAPPDVLRVDEKNLREYAVPNVCGLIITSNHKTNGIHLPPDDRRHYVAWSGLTKENFADDYWSRLYGRSANAGTERVAAYLADLDLTKFDPKAPPPKTAAFYEIVAAGRAPEDNELVDALNELNWPEVLTLSKVADKAAADFAMWLRDRKNSRLIPHRMEACGYVAIQNPADATDGRWRVNGKRQVIYGKAELSVRDRTLAAQRLAAQQS